jgi:hypothetical protein
MNTEVKPAADAESTSREDKFFGLKTSIEDMVPDDDDVIIDEADEKTAKEPAEEGATDKDIGDYSQKVQKRFDKLTWEKKEEERQKLSVIAERDEAYRVAKALHQQSQQQAQIISTGEARLVEQIKDRARMSVEAARGKYRKAFEEGNTDEIVSAQEELIRAQSENKAALDYDAEYRQRVSNWAAQQQQRQQQQAWQAQQPRPQQQQQPELKQPTRAATTWAKNNPWFGKNEHRDMTAIAYATHETMIRDKGIAPDSDEYFEELDATMKLRFPEYYEAEEGHSSHSVSRPNVVVAPATRSGANTRKVTLNASQRSLAKVLGIEESDYAKQLLKEQKRG